MSLEFNTKHLRVLNLLQFTRGENLDFIESILEISRPNLNNYLKEIHTLISNKEKTGKMDIIIKDIIKKKEIINSFKENHTVSKEDRIFFLILKLLIDSTLNLDSLSDLLKISRRTLNADLVNMRKDLSIFDLKIESHAGRGIFLEGEKINKKRVLCCYIYKYFVEEEFLPKIFKDNFSSIKLDPEIGEQLMNDIEKIMCNSNFDMFFYNRVLLLSFYISFKYVQYEDIIEEYPHNTLEFTLKDKFCFKTYFSKAFSDDELSEFYNYLHNSLFKHVSFDDISSFLNILKICRGNFPEEKIYLENHTLKWRKIIKNALDRNLTIHQEEALRNHIIRLGFSSKQKHYLTVYELHFLKLNMDFHTSKSCIALYKEFKKYYWNVSFMDVMIIYFILNAPKKTENKKITIFYETIPKYILETMKEQLEYKYNITILDFVNIHFFEEYKKNNDVKIIGVFADLKLFNKLKDSDETLEIIHLDLKI